MCRPARHIGRPAPVPRAFARNAEARRYGHAEIGGNRVAVEEDAGEAVAIGIALDVIYSRRAGFLDAASAERVLDLLEELEFELFASDLLARDAAGKLLLLDGLEEFREHLGGRLAITLLHAIGVGFEVNEVNSAVVEEAIDELKSRPRGGSVCK